ncbi:hypothetical protein [Roseomonas xinghualingensis]|nr:hypothetical protein [Roseomonas sp. SXEYE001]MCV4210010.1 hypothetical protein [Roseomonas sp. SXEYE001]
MIPTSSIAVQSYLLRWRIAGGGVARDILPALALMGGTLFVLMLTGLISP